TAACRANRSAFHVGMALTDEPLLVLQLARVTITDDAIRTFERLLAQGELSPTDLTAMQRLLEAEAGRDGLLEGLRGERAFLFEGGQALAPWQPGWSSNFLSMPFLGDWATSNGGRLLDFLNQVVEHAKLPAEEQGAAFLTDEMQIRATAANKIARVR